MSLSPFIESEEFCKILSPKKGQLSCNNDKK